jgi:hypothetical protein
MAFIATVTPGRATGELAATYRYMGEISGAPMVAKIVQLFSLRPASVRAMVRGWELAMWAGETPRALRELVGAMVSRLNDCHY